MLSEERRRPVRIVVVGDEKSGKTSLVVAATNESFPDACPPVVPPALLPAECTPEGVPLHLIDTSSRPEERAALDQTVLKADVVVLLFDAARPQSLKRISSYWMPELRKLGLSAPVVLAGTKVDVSKHQDVTELAQPVMKKYREIETCVECSSKRLVNVVEVFYSALKAVIYPVAPVFDQHVDDGQGALKPLCIRALKRVFLMNDRDKDGALSDAELNAFQVNCFSAPLQPEELIGIRKVVSEEMPQGVNGAGLTLPGFLFLHALFIERGRLETVWAVLRKYGYDESLGLSQAVLNEVNFARSPDQVVEMTKACRNFFSGKFVEFDRDGDKVLSIAEQSEMFSVAPTGPWRGKEYRGLLVENGGEGKEEASLTLQGFLAKWAFTTATDPARVLAYARYLGFEGPAAPLFSISKPRRQERKAEQLQRSVVQAFVFLGESSGRGLLTCQLARRESSAAADVEAPSPAQALGAAAGEIRLSTSDGAGPARTLILHEMQQEALDALEQEPGGLAAADAAAFVFDGASLDSLRAALKTLLRAARACGDSLPCLLVALESEDGMSKEVAAECSEICSELELQQPMAANAGSPDDVPAILRALLRAAAQPEKALAIPQTPSLKAAKQYQRMLKLAGLYVAGGMAGGLLCYAAYKSYANRRSSTNDLPSLQGSSSAARLPEPSRSSR